MEKNTLLKTAKNPLSTKRTKFHLIIWAFLSILFTALFVLVTIYFSPNTDITFMNFRFISFTPFFLSLFLLLFSWVTLITKSKSHGILIALFVIIYLIFRLNHLTNPFFLVLLLALFVTLELFVSSRK